MITLVLGSLALSFGLSTRVLWKRNRRMKAQLARIAASNDDELMAVLQATDSPLATKLLHAAVNKNTYTMTKQIEILLSKIIDAEYSMDQVSAVKRFVANLKDGQTITKNQCNTILSMLKFDSDANKLRSLLLGRING